MNAPLAKALTHQPELVRDVKVRLVASAERSLWNSLMKQYHYLGFQSLVGQSLRYVAVHEGQWLALLGWGSAALKCKARDQWIGWTEALKLLRLPLVANNARFLILPGVGIPNLASRILALNLKRLSDDWYEAHGHPIYLAETFVDPRFYRGTCYRTAEWLYLGTTQSTEASVREAPRPSHHHPACGWKSHLPVRNAARPWNRDAFQTRPSE